MSSDPSIEGPWSDPVYITNGGIDPDLFENENSIVSSDFDSFMLVSG